MKSLNWSEYGFSKEEQALLEATEDDGWDIGTTIYVWKGWAELSLIDFRWLPVELESACSIRDDVEICLGNLPDTLRLRVCKVVDEFDRLFRTGTVSSGKLFEGEWWWGRVPFNTYSRLFFRQDWQDRRVYPP